MKHTLTPAHAGSGTPRPTLGLAALALLLPGAALAHPGHGGGFLPGLLHPFHGLDHLLAAVVVGVWALPAAFVAAMLGGTLAVRAVGVLPATEPMIAASVLVLGMLLAFNARLDPAAGMALVGSFAVFHGAAHGTGAPADGSFALHATGLGLATLTLHGAGIAAAAALRSKDWLARAVGAPIALTGAWMLIARLG